MNGAQLIAAERERQIDVHGYVSELDDQYNGTDGPELIRAGMTYAMFAGMMPEDRAECRSGEIAELWPWSKRAWKPGKGDTNAERIRELTKAGALIAAEIDRLQRCIARGEA